MANASSIELNRDTAAVRIPSGETVSLPKGMLVDITQLLGGTFTVQTSQGLFRIAGQDADALGLTPEASDAAKQTPAGAGGAAGEEQVWVALRSCYDPEIPVNIVDLGLVYDVHLEQLTGGKSKVDVKMTLTAPGCGMGPVIASDAQQKLLDLDWIEEASVELVWDPPWHQSMITAEGRRILGLE
jgi:probable FeS assembly SUF system protein SufT